MVDSKQKARIDSLVEIINKAIDDYVLDPEKLRSFFQFKQQFNQYSIRNAMLINLQFNGAIQAASYNKWKEMGYQVKKGSKAIYILAPSKAKMIYDQNNKKIGYLSQIGKKEKELLTKGEYKAKDQIIGYRTVPVFDIQQTNCPINEYPEYIKQFYLVGQTNCFNELFNSLDNYRDHKEVKWIPTNQIKQNGARGFYDPNSHAIWLNPRNEPRQFLKTYIHELAHSQMHQNKNIDSRLAEYQAELTASIVSNYYGFGDIDVNVAYIKNHIGDMEIKDKENLISEVMAVTEEIVESVDKYLEVNYHLKPSQDQEINNLIAIQSDKYVAGRLPNEVIEAYDLLAKDKDLDGVIDRNDADEKDSTINSIGDLYDKAQDKSLTERLKEKIDGQKNSIV